MPRVRFAWAIEIGFLRSLPRATIPGTYFYLSLVADASTRHYDYLLPPLLHDEDIYAVQEGWAGTFGVDTPSFVAPPRWLPPHYHETRRASLHDPRGLDTERRARSIICVIVHHIAEDVFCFNRRVADGTDSVAPPEFRRIEVPMGCHVPVGPVPLLLGTVLAVDPCSAKWVVFGVHLLPIAAANMMWEAFNRRRLWIYLSTLCTCIRELPLAGVVGAGEVDKTMELLRLVKVIDRTTVRRRQRSCRADRYPYDHSGTRVGVVGDFVYVDAMVSPARRIDEAEFRAGVGQVRQEACFFDHGPLCPKPAKPDDTPSAWMVDAEAVEEAPAGVGASVGTPLTARAVQDPTETAVVACELVDGTSGDGGGAGRSCSNADQSGEAVEEERRQKDLGWGRAVARQTGTGWDTEDVLCAHGGKRLSSRGDGVFAVEVSNVGYFGCPRGSS